MSSLNAALIKSYAPNARPDIVTALVEGEADMAAAGVNSARRFKHFMAQIATETGGFEIYVENMNYSAERLMQVWPTHFRTLEFAQDYAHNPERLANYIYDDANRGPAYKLGNVNPGDGWRYRGRGLMQVTGRFNYKRYGYEVGPERLTDPKVGLKAALEEFKRTGCLELADQNELAAIRRKINGGLTGLDQARQWLSRGELIFGETIPMATAPQSHETIGHAEPDHGPLTNEPIAPTTTPQVVALGIGAAIIGAIIAFFNQIEAWVHSTFHF